MNDSKLLFKKTLDVYVFAVKGRLQENYYFKF